MAVQQLIRSVQRLTSQTGTCLTLYAGRDSITIAKTCRLLTSSGVGDPKLFRSVHTSTVCLRRLDSHAYPPSKEPSSNGRWEPRKKISEMYEYTTDPIPMPRTGGRGPNGRIWNHRRAGGWKKDFYMIDWIRGGPPSGSPLIEKVDDIHFDPNRSAFIALVASGEKKRYIIATTNMKPGDLIKSSTMLSKTAVRASEGDAYPLGSLPVGMMVNCVELYPGAGALLARSAGCTAQLVRKVDDRCIIRLPSKQEINVSAECVATVGQVSNEDHDKRIIGKAGRNRWLGFKPNSGRWHRKTGRFGRKIKGPKKVLVYTTPKEPLHKKVPMYQRHVTSSVL